MLTTTAAWKRSFNKKNIKKVYLVRITVDALGSEGNGIYTFLHGRNTNLGYPNSVLSIASISGKLDALTRKYSQSDYEIIFADDGYIRNLITLGKYLRHKKLTIKLGTSELTSETDFTTTYLGAIKDLVADSEAGTISLTGIDASAFTNWPIYDKVFFTQYRRGGGDPNLARGIARNHPLEVVSRSLDALNIPTELYNASSLDAETDTTRSHFVITRHNDNLIPVGLETDFNLDKPVKDHISEMMFLMYGAFIPDSDARFTYKQFDNTAPPVTHWTTKDIISVRQTSTYKNLYNRIEMAHPIFAEPYQVSSIEDSISAANNAYPGDDGTSVFRKESEYLNAFATIVQVLDNLDAPVGILPAGVTDHKITSTYVLHNGFSGSLVNNHANWYGRGDNSIRGINNTTRKAYLLLINPRTKVLEVVAATLITAPSGAFGTTNAPTEALSAGVGSLRLAHTIQFNITERGLFGTTSLEWNSLYTPIRIIDITIPVMSREIVLQRYTNGAPELEVVTLPHTADIQVGDFISLD